MRNSRITWIRLAALLALLPAVPAFAYTVLTLDGHRIEALERPEVIGLQARLRLVPHGLLVVIHEERIDWKATEELNAASEPQRQILAVPADTVITGGESPAAPAAPAPPQQQAPIEHKITGSAPVRTPAATAPPDAAPPSVTPEALEELARLAEEQSRIMAILEQAMAQKTAIEEEAARIKNRPEAPASLSSEDIARLRELEKIALQTLESVRAAQERLQQIKVRLDQIKSAAPQN